MSLLRYSTNFPSLEPSRILSQQLLRQSILKFFYGGQLMGISRLEMREERKQRKHHEKAVHLLNAGLGQLER